MTFELEKNIIETRGDRDEKTKKMLKEAIEFHLMLADMYYKVQLIRKAKVVFLEDIAWKLRISRVF